MTNCQYTQLQVCVRLLLWLFGEALAQRWFAYAGVHQADRALVSDQHRLLPLHAGPVLPGQRGGPEGESQGPRGSAGRAFILCLPQALQCFQEAATEVEKEEFLIRLTGSEEEEAAAASPRLQYFNKVLTHSHTLRGLRLATCCR